MPFNLKKLFHTAEAHPDPRKQLAANPRLVVVFLVLLVGIFAGGLYFLRTLNGDGNTFTVSGNIEATEIHIGTEVGGQIDRLTVDEGDKVQAGAVLAVIHGTRIYAPADGTVLVRAVEPGEVATQGSTLMILGDLNALTLTVYVPEDKYGQIKLGQVCSVTVDSFPDLVFNGTVSHIADKAEFTPRNVQTTDSRKTTVFAIRLNLPPSDGKLKPGMPADVHFPINQ
jgi:HlyD family secretion protein